MKWISVLQLVLLYPNMIIKPIGILFAAIQRIGTHWPSQWQSPPPPSTHPKEIDTELQNDRWMRQTNDCKDRPTHSSSSQQRLRAIRWSIWTDTTVVSTCSLGHKHYLFICLPRVEWLPTVVLPMTTFTLAIWTTQTVNRVVIHRWGPCSPLVLIDWIQQEVTRGLL